MDNGDSGPGAQWMAPDLHDKMHKSRHPSPSPLPPHPPSPSSIIILMIIMIVGGSGLGAAAWILWLRDEYGIFEKVSFGGRVLRNASAMIAEREALRMGIEHLTVLFPTEVSSFDVQVECTERTVLYKLNAQSLRLFGLYRDVNDAHRAGANRLQNKNKQPLKGPIIPFGALVEYYLISAKTQSRIHQFGKKVFPVLFLRSALYAGGIWKGDVLIADLEELETMDASEIYSKRLNAKEFIFPKENGKYFSSRRWTNQTSWRRLGPENIHLGTANIDFLGGSEGSLPPPQDSLPDAGEAINDFWWPGDGAPKAGQKQAAADSRGSRTCVCASTLLIVGCSTRRGGRAN